MQRPDETSDKSIRRERNFIRPTIKLGILIQTKQEKGNKRQHDA